MARKIKPFVIDSSGEVVGGFSAQPCPASIHGWAFNNTAASAATVKIYTPTASKNGTPALPSAAGTLVITINIPATASKEYFEGDGEIFFTDGAYAITSASTCTGCLLIS